MEKGTDPLGARAFINTVAPQDSLPHCHIAILGTLWRCCNMALTVLTRLLRLLSLQIKRRLN